MATLRVSRWQQRHVYRERGEFPEEGRRYFLCTVDMVTMKKKVHGSYKLGRQVRVHEYPDAVCFVAIIEGSSQREYLSFGSFEDIAREFEEIYGSDVTKPFKNPKEI